jgi:hypothetical protein
MAPLQNLCWPESHAVSTFKVLAESTMFLFMLLRWGGALNCILVFWRTLGFNFEHLAQGCVNGVKQGNACCKDCELLHYAGLRSI